MSDFKYLLKDVTAGMFYCRVLPNVMDPADHVAVAEMVGDALNFLAQHGCTDMGVFSESAPMRGAASGMGAAYVSTKYIFFRVSYTIAAPFVVRNAHVDVPS